MKKLFSFRLPAGFTLIEIVIVVAIIGILAVIGIPGFLRVRMNANEGAIREDLRTFSSASESYRAVQIPPSYATGISTLINDDYIDNTWLNPGNKNGYSFVYQLGTGGLTYGIEANPLEPGITGVNYYCVDQTGVIVHGSSVGLATIAGCSGGTPIGS